MNQINQDLQTYIQTSILPQYEPYDKAHSTDHIAQVINNSLTIAEDYPVDRNLVYTIAAYHDIGIRFGRKDHHITSGNYLLEDKELTKWFSQDELYIMKEAIEDHRASNDYEPRSIYGKIVAEADRDIIPETIIYRTMEYGKKNYPNYSFEEQFIRSYEHIVEKYGVNGYLKLWLETKQNREGLKALQELVEDKDRLKEICKRFY